MAERGPHTLSEHLAAGSLIEGLIRTVAEEIGIKSEMITPDTPLGDLGIDSVAAVSLRNHIENDLRISIPSLDYFNDHSVNDIASLILSQSPDSGSASLKNKPHETGFEEGEI